MVDLRQSSLESNSSHMLGSNPEPLQCNVEGALEYPTTNSCRPINKSLTKNPPKTLLLMYSLRDGCVDRGSMV